MGSRVSSHFSSAHLDRSPGHHLSSCNLCERCVRVSVQVRVARYPAKALEKARRKPRSFKGCGEAGSGCQNLAHLELSCR